MVSMAVMRERKYPPVFAFFARAVALKPASKAGELAQNTAVAALRVTGYLLLSTPGQPAAARARVFMPGRRAFSWATTSSKLSSAKAG